MFEIHIFNKLLRISMQNQRLQKILNPLFGLKAFVPPPLPFEEGGGDTKPFEPKNEFKAFWSH
jgi:hypothetical protein